MILVDDGLATGSTMRAAVAAVRRQQPARIVVAVPAGAASACRRLEQDADQVVCASTPEPFVAVGQAYRSFEQTTDEEVRGLLHAAGAAGAAHDQPPAAGPTGVGPGPGSGPPARGLRLLPLTPATSMALPRTPPAGQTPKRRGRARERLTAPANGDAVAEQVPQATQL